MSVLLFFIAALRAVVEMLGLSLIGLGVMALFAGNGRQKNPIYQLFDLITRAPRRCVAALIPGQERQVLAACLCFVLLFMVWVGLAIWRVFLLDAALSSAG